MWTDKLAFIGAGNIAQVIIDRLIGVGALSASHIFACDIRYDRREYLRQTYRGIHTGEDAHEAVEFAKCIVVATPADAVIPVLHDISKVLTTEHMVLCLATSVKLSQLQAAVGDVPVARGLVNTPSLVGEGMNMVTFASTTPPDYRQKILRLLDLLGPKFEVSDSQMNFWCAMCSAGPMYVFPMIDALARAAESRGIHRHQALIGAAQVVLGAARMVQQTGKDPLELEKLTAGLRTMREDEIHNLYMQAYEETLNNLNRAAALVGV